MEKGTVHWKYKKTNQKGHGEPIDIEAAEAAAKEANETYNAIHHWVKLAT